MAAAPNNPNAAYWQKRFKLIEQQSNQTGANSLSYIAEQYQKAAQELEAQISTWYTRLAQNNGVTMHEAKQLLSSGALKEFHWTVQEYIKYGQENALNGAWMQQLENASAKWHITKLEALQLQNQATIEALFGAQYHSLTDTLGNIYQSSFYQSCFEVQKAFGIGWDVSAIDENKLSAVLSTPWTLDGNTFSDRLWANKQKLIQTTQSTLTQGIMTGRKPDKLIKELQSKMNASRSNAGRLVMTESAAISAMGQKDAFGELGIEAFEVVETLDNLTCEVCAAMDGQHFPMSDYEIGVTVPPFHPWCRGCTCPYFHDDFTASSERIARAADGTQYYVPGDTAYQEWKAAFVDGDKSGFDVAVNELSGLTSYKQLQDSGNDGIIDSDDWKGLKYSQNYDKKTAVARLKSEYGIQFNDSRKYAMDGDLLADCVGWLDSFYAQYSSFLQRNPCQIPAINNKAPAKMKKAVGYYSYYTNSPNVVELALNGQYHSNAAAFQEYVEHAVQSKWYPANATIHKTFVHEFGHHVSNSMRWITQNPNWEHEFIQSCIEEFRKIEPNYTWSTYIGMGDYVSRYGAKSESELFAEAFAEYFGGENPRTFAKIFGKRLDTLLKGV